MQAKPKVVTLPGSTQFPMIKEVSTKIAAIVATVIFAEPLNQRQIDVLRDMYARYKKRLGFEWKVALGVNGKEVTFRVFSGKSIPPENEVRKMLEALGLDETNYVEPANPKMKSARRPMR